jgi:hypothetical protein
MKRHGTLIFFAICAVIDFVFGWMRAHSVSAGIIRIVVGLPFNAVLMLIFRAWERHHHSARPPDAG